MQLPDDGPLEFRPGTPPIILVATEQWNRLTDRALVFSMRLSPDVVAVHIVTAEEPDPEANDRALLAQWARDVETPARAAAYKPPRLLLLKNPYRRFRASILELLRQWAAADA